MYLWLLALPSHVIVRGQSAIQIGPSKGQERTTTERNLKERVTNNNII